MIAVFSNPYRDTELKYARRCAEMLNAEGFEAEIYKVFAEEEMPEISDISLLIIIGGDGTILEVIRKLKNADVPVLGINLGTVGFMASIEPEEIEHVLDAVRGNFSFVNRMMLDVYVNGEYCGCALNDAVIHGYGDTITLTTKSDETQISSFSGDGIIVSTPTGSTGYSLSAGGPIVEPDAEALIVSPICAHQMCSRSFVLDSCRSVEVSLNKAYDRKAYVSLDGKNIGDLSDGDVMRVVKSQRYTKLISPWNKSFYETAYEKLR